MDVMKRRAALALATVVAVLTLRTEAPAAAKHTPDAEERLSAVLRSLPPEQRRPRMRISRMKHATEEPVRPVMRPGAFKALRARHLPPPRGRVTSDPSITLRYARKIDGFCTTLPEQTRKTVLDDATCAEAHARAAAAR
jgi:hypothetical protein